jgi:hypothetical protein
MVYSQERKGSLKNRFGHDEKRSGLGGEEVRELLEAFVWQCKYPWASHELPDYSFPPSPQELAKDLRERGFPVQVYRLVKPCPLPFAHLIWEESLWDAHLPPLRPSKRAGMGVIVGEPPTGRWFELLRASLTHTRELPDVLVIYAFTNDAADIDTGLFPELADFFKAAKEQGRNVVYVDSVGLIPEETVRLFGKGEERNGFNQAFQSIQEGVEAIAQGRPPMEAQSPFWRKLYEFLAEKRIRSVAESLSYELWREIVDFDHLNLSERALTELLTGFPEEAAKTMLRQIITFHELNCLRRAKALAHQLVDLKEKDPKVLFFLAREIGHYGALEAALPVSWRIQTKILGQERIPQLLACPGIEGLLLNLEVNIPEESWDLLALHHCLKVLLLPYLERGPRKVAQFFGITGIEKLSFMEIKKIVEELQHPLAILQRTQGHSISEQLFYLLRARNLVPDEKRGWELGFRGEGGETAEGDNKAST